MERLRKVVVYEILTQTQDLVGRLVALPAEAVEGIRILPAQIQGVHCPGPSALVAAKVGALCACAAKADTPPSERVESTATLAALSIMLLKRGRSRQNALTMTSLDYNECLVKLGFSAQKHMHAGQGSRRLDE